MPQHPIAAVLPQLRAALAGRGWEIVQEEPWREDLWILAVWTLRSLWSPTAVQLALVFAFDDHLSWVAISREEPQDYASTQWHGERLNLKRSWERDLPAFLASLDELREQSGRQ
jgi:hypothetical protein